MSSKMATMMMTSGDDDDLVIDVDDDIFGDTKDVIPACVIQSRYPFNSVLNCF